MALSSRTSQDFPERGSQRSGLRETGRAIGGRLYPRFRDSCIDLVMELREYCTSLVLDLDSYDGEDFVMMVGMGFFVRTHQSYQMTIPPCLTAEKVRAAVIGYANTEDEEYMLHPESLITTLPFAQAKALQNRLRAVDEFNRDGAYRAYRVTNH